MARGPQLLLAIATALGLAGPAPAAITYRLGAGVQAGYNSALVQPVQLLGQSSGTVSGLTFGVTPFVELRSQTGRLDLNVGYTFLGELQVLVRERAPAFSYQNALQIAGRADLTSKLVWELGVGATQGRLNTFAQIQSAGAQTIEAPNLVASEFLSVNTQSALRWDATARLRLLQPATFRAFIPYGTITRERLDGGGREEVSVTGALQSYTLDGGLGIEQEWARARLGAEVRLGWFLPQRGAGVRQDSNLSLVTGQALLRGVAELGPRWRGELHLGLYAATQADAFLKGRHIVGEGPNIREVQSTLLSPIGGLSLSYLFPQEGAQLSLTYLHGAAGEVFVGRFTLSDAVTLRAIVPLPRKLGMAMSLGYRYADLYSGSTLARVEYRVDPVTGYDRAFAIGNAYHLALADAQLHWAVRDGVHLFVRYAYQFLKMVDQPLEEDQIGLQDFDRHLATAGLRLFWPATR